MNRRNGWVAVAVAGLGIAGCGSGAPSRRAETVVAEALPVAADTIVVPWVNIPEAAALGGRRWVVVGADHDAAVFVDFATRKTEPIGPAAPGELVKPFATFAIADSAVIGDWSKGRLTIWSPDGKLVRAVPAPPATRGVLPRARDAAGNYYFEIPPVAGPDGSGLRDSAAVVRSDPGLAKFDTVARLAPLDIAEVTEQRGKRYERLVFSGNDWWGVRPDGRVWIARVRRNEVSTVTGTKEKKGERLPDPVLEVTRVDREQYVQTFPTELRPMAEKLQYAPLKPPFERAFGSTDGAVWLRKTKTAIDSVRRYHLVDTTGSLSRVFTTVGRGVIIAATGERALLAEQFKDGVRLMEIRLPSPPPPPAATK